MIKKLDVISQVYPFLLIEAQSALAALQSGDELVIDFDCTQTTEGLPQWAAEQGISSPITSRMGVVQWSITLKKPEAAPGGIAKRRIAKALDGGTGFHQGRVDAVFRRVEAGV